MAGPQVRIGRVYDPVQKGFRRILADRIWPRGMRKTDPRTGQWWPELAPSTELRRWYGHAPERFDSFATRYRRELDSGAQREALDRLQALADTEPVMLVTATGQVARSHLAVLAEVLGG